MQTIAKYLCVVRRASSLRLALALLLGSGACAGTQEADVRRDLAEARQRLAARRRQAAPEPELTPEPGHGGAPPAPQGDGAGESGQAAAPAGHLSGYLAAAMAHQPELAAAFARFEASVAQISRARRLPEPTLSFGYFLQSVETRVGPQRARVSIQQTFPWPTKLFAGADAASARARAAQRRFEASALTVTERVATAYWDLWQVRRVRDIRHEHLTVLEGLSETVQARLATGAALLADQQQVDLTLARLQDAIAGLDERERAANARLQARVGLSESGPLPTTDEPPPPCLPGEDEATLRQQVLEHPQIAAFAMAAKAHEATARMEAADRLPSFSVGADWIATGAARMDGVADSGKDAVMVGVGLRLPIFQGSYGESVAAAEAESRAERASGRAATDRALAELSLVLSELRDAARRVALHEHTLLPQAEAAYQSILGAYATGRSSVAQMLLSQRDLLELNISLQQARADYARAWARLEQVVGRRVAPGRECARQGGAEEVNHG